MEAARWRVNAPKTGATRKAPLFPELLPYIEEAWDLAEEGEMLVCPLAERSPSGTLRGVLRRAALWAGVQSWPRVWHALRAPRETELLAVYSPHLVAAWIGHTIQVQQTADATVTDADFDRAAGLQQGADSGRNDLQRGKSERTFRLRGVSFSAVYRSLQLVSIPT